MLRDVNDVMQAHVLCDPCLTDRVKAIRRLRTDAGKSADFGPSTKGTCPKQYLAGFGTTERCGRPEHHDGACGPAEGPRAGQHTKHYQQTSREAHARVSAGWEERVTLALGQATAGLTVDELERQTGGRHQTVSAAISRLWHEKHLVQPIVRNGERVRRMTSSGRLADVYELAPSSTMREILG